MLNTEMDVMMVVALFIFSLLSLYQIGIRASHYRRAIKADNKKIRYSFLVRLLSALAVLITFVLLSVCLYLIINRGISLLSYTPPSIVGVILGLIIRVIAWAFGLFIISVGGLGMLLYAIFLIFSIDKLLISPVVFDPDNDTEEWREI